LIILRSGALENGLGERHLNLWQRSTNLRHPVDCRHSSGQSVVYRPLGGSEGALHVFVVYLSHVRSTCTYLIEGSILLRYDMIRDAI